MTVNLVPPGSKFGDRWNQLDVSVQRAFRFGRLELQPSSTCSIS